MSGGGGDSGICNDWNSDEEEEKEEDVDEIENMLDRCMGGTTRIPPPSQTTDLKKKKNKALGGGKISLDDMNRLIEKTKRKLALAADGLDITTNDDDDDDDGDEELRDNYVRRSRHTPQFVELSVFINDKFMEGCAYYYPNINATDASRILTAYPVGTYLVRDSASPDAKYTLCIHAERGSVLNLRILESFGQYYFECENRRVVMQTVGYRQYNVGSLIDEAMDDRTLMVYVKNGKEKKPLADLLGQPANKET